MPARLASPPQRALVEFLEIDAGRLAAAAAGSEAVSRSSAAQDQHIDTWLDEWPREEMMAVLKLIAQGQSLGRNGSNALRPLDAGRAGCSVPRRPAPARTAATAPMPAPA